MTLEEIAEKLAIDAKATGFDLGDLYDDDWNLNDEDWSFVVALATAIMPMVIVPDEVATAWRQANRDVDAEIAHERRQLGIG